MDNLENIFVDLIGDPSSLSSFILNDRFFNRVIFDWVIFKIKKNKIRNIVKFKISFKNRFNIRNFV